MSNLTIEEQLAVLQAENDRLKALNQAKAKKRELTLKVSEKGAISIYGLRQRFPVTLYSEEMTRVLDAAPAIRAFMEANKAKLATKEE